MPGISRPLIDGLVLHAAKILKQLRSWSGWNPCLRAAWFLKEAFQASFGREAFAALLFTFRITGWLGKLPFPALLFQPVPFTSRFLQPSIVVMDGTELASSMLKSIYRYYFRMEKVKPQTTNAHPCIPVTILEQLSFQPYTLSFYAGKGRFSQKLQNILAKTTKYRGPLITIAGVWLFSASFSSHYVVYSSFSPSHGTLYALAM